MKTILQQFPTVVCLTALLFSFCCTRLFAQDLLIAFPTTLPPWTLQAHNKGITVEIMRNALKLRGYKMKAKYLPLTELNQNLAADTDAHAQVESPNLKGHYSAKIMDFQTSLISLKPRGLTIQSISDLQHQRIIAFQNASQLFGKSFLAMSQANARYQEILNQEIQVVQLYNGETDLILIDKNTFLYFQQITVMTNTSMPVTYHQLDNLTKKSPAFVVFHDEKLRDDFNIGLQQLKENGDYYDIFYKYTRIHTIGKGHESAWQGP